ncbi:2,4-dihydroxyhept-2-ene-1,7-dioic acid aldolase [Hyphomicrobiales bacterium]|nr:2,4-dihydroxyhept-2-ene-1,7-dioic acid aldolase [Hyphomicrobiales bacterium]CAH1690012.1 2,4-dihydroxyhept-2-ene-1,7-dioic acid aldolase [Hyphomicrobiales bacterium]
MPAEQGAAAEATLMSGQRVRTRLLAGERLAGAWLSLGSSIAAEIAAGAGFDWLLFDLEHGTSEYSELLYQLQAISAFPTASIVRVPAIDASIFKRILDLGAHGLMIPQVASAEQARLCVDFARIPPQGIRGAAQTTRASGYGLHYEQYLRDANSAIILLAQIESRQGVANADAIAAVNGIDALFVGPTDLGVDLGTSLKDPDGEFRASILAVADAAKRHGKAAGVLVRNLEQARGYAELGYSVIALGSDRGLIASGMRANVAALGGLHVARAQPNLKAVSKVAL